MSSSQVLTALAQKCELLESQFPQYRVILAKVPWLGGWVRVHPDAVLPWSEPPRNAEAEAEAFTTAFPDVFPDPSPLAAKFAAEYAAETNVAASFATDADDDVAAAAFNEITNVIVRILHRAGMDFETPWGAVSSSDGQVNGWCRVLMCAFDYYDPDDHMDYPVSPTQRHLENPFFLTRILLHEIAGLIDQGVKVPEIFNRIMHKPKWPRYEDLNWDDDNDKAVDENESKSDRKFTQQHLDTVRNILKTDSTMTHYAIKHEFKKKNGNGIGNLRLQAILDHVRKNFPGEYTVEPRKRKA